MVVSAEVVLFSASGVEIVDVLFNDVVVLFDATTDAPSND